MAEATVEERPSQKFYCHLCRVDFTIVTADFTCPHCSDGFIEELLDTPENNDMMDEDLDENEVPINDFIISSFPVIADNLPSHIRGGNRITRRTVTRLTSSNLRQNNIPFENIIQDLFVNLGVGLNLGAPGNMQWFLGNPGDYAWGREGLDAIVTQLLNQMDSAGPPPVSKQVIDALPIVKVTTEQIERKLQCSVCWEDFMIDETVRQLPCTHVYHEPCIRPWLELHGTCPICRKNLINDQSDNKNQDSGGSGGNGIRFTVIP